MIIGVCLLALVALVIFETLFIKYNGSAVPRPAVPRGEQVIGQGPVLRYAILGDSTAIAQGAEYTHGYAVASARHLAKNHQVIWKNFAVSGSRAADVQKSQLPQARSFRPDVALIAVGANDVTHLTSTRLVKAALQQTIDALRLQNPAISIILTGSPDMGSVPRFPWPVNQLADRKTRSLNKMIVVLADQKHVVFAPVAAKTGPTFRAHRELYAADNFHPNDAGYQVWIPVINQAIDKINR